MTHEPSTEQLAMYARDKAEPELKAWISAHLATGCRACHRQLEWVRSVLEAHANDPAEELPDVLRAAADRIFADYTRGRLERKRGILHAIMVFDSEWIPLPVGVRSPAFGQRRLLFHAHPYEIDLEITRMRRGTLDVLGQVSPSDRLPTSSEVSVRHRGLRVTGLDDRGFFSFSAMSPGVVGLTFKLGNQTIKLSQVRIE